MQDAASLAETVLEQAPDDPDACYLRGVIANRLRDHPAAIRAFERAVAAQPDHTLAWLGLGNARARSDRLDAAADAYRRVLEREPEWADAHFNLGVIHRRQGRRAEAARAMYEAWSNDPMFDEAAKQCVSAVADCVRHGEAPGVERPLALADAGSSITVVICSADDDRHDRALSLYRRLLAGRPHEIVGIRNARSLAGAYNDAIARSRADFVVLSHDDVDVLAADFAARLVLQLQRFDAVGVVGSTRMDGPAVGWSGHPHLRGWITHRAPDEPRWHVDVLDFRRAAGDVVVLDGVMIAARRAVLAAVPFDEATFDGFHLYDLDWSYRAARAGYRLGVCGELLLVHASRGRYADDWQRYADRFCAKHDAGRHPPRPSSFFGAVMESPDDVRAFFGMLAALDRASHANRRAPGPSS